MEARQIELLSTPLPNDSQKQQAASWFCELRDHICATFEKIEQDYARKKGGEPGHFTFRDWQKPDGGGGRSGIMKGQVFEKVGVNFSQVHGSFKEEFQKKIPGTEEDSGFWASGISLVAHMHSPIVPAAHFNTRHIITGKSWFGGGGDMTPYVPFDEDSKAFHQAFKTACDTYDQSLYPAYKKWCDEYFYLKHRKEPRGIGGIFYDYHNTGDWDRDMAFTRDVGRAFETGYEAIIRKRMFAPWTEEQRHHQLVKRGRYVEFNLLYDRGTHFGLQTNGDTEAILMSLPPEVHWP